jgi:hypothetical protein
VVATWGSARIVLTDCPVHRTCSNRADSAAQLACRAEFSKGTPLCKPRIQGRGVSFGVIIALERCERGQGVDDCGGCECKACSGDVDHCRRKFAIALGKFGQYAKEDECECAAGYTSPCHYAFSDRRHLAADVATLEQCTEDTDYAE